MVFIRTDANAVIATGHVMRCAAVAKQVEAAGQKVCFLVSDSDSARLVSEKGFTCMNLHSDWDNPCNEKELKQMQEILDNEGQRMASLPVLLLDSYRITGEYTKRLSGLAKRAVMDDLFEQTFCAEMVINYTLYHKRFDYAGRYKKSGAQLLLGGSYIPLRPDFDGRVRCRQAAAGKPMNILLICGGGDVLNALGQILLAAVQNPSVMQHSFQVVAGALNPYKEQLAAYAAAYPNIRVHENVTDMAALMAQCDLAVSAAGTVLYECCAMRLPTVFFCVADNQRYDAFCFTEEDRMVYAGDFREAPDDTVTRILAAVCRLGEDFEARRIMQQKLSVVTDGQGARRIAAALLAL